MQTCVSVTDRVGGGGLHPAGGAQLPRPAGRGAGQARHGGAGPREVGAGSGGGDTRQKLEFHGIWN